MNDTASASHFADVARLFAEQPTLEATLQEITDAARAEVTCDHVSVSFVQRRGRIHTVAATDPILEEADSLQHELHEGPCLGAIWERGVFVSQDIADDPRWPNWGPKAAALGLGSLLAVRLTVGHHVEGALNLYGRHRRQFDADEVEHAEIYAAHASVALAAQREQDSLNQAIGARHLIGMAQGMLMERYDLTPDAAFKVLRRHSMDLNIKLREVAATIIQTRELPAITPTASRSTEGEDA